MESATDRNRRIGYALAVVSALGTGISTVIGKWNLQAIDSLALNCGIFTIATVLMSTFWLPFHGVKRTFSISRRGWLWTFIFAATSAVAVWAFWAGVDRMDPSLAGFLNRSEVPMAIILGIIFLGERFTRWETLGAAIAIAGIVTMKATLRMEYSEGFWLVLGGAVFFALTELASKVAMRYVEPAVLAYIRNAMMGIMYWIWFWIVGGTLDGMEEVWVGVLALGFMGPVFNRTTYLMALKRLELSKVAVIGQLQPVFTIIVAYFALSLLPTVREVIGGVCLVAGCVILVLFRKRRRPRPTADPTAPVK